MKYPMGLVITQLAIFACAASLDGQETASSSSETSTLSMESVSTTTAEDAGVVTSTVQTTETTSLSSVRPKTVYAFSGGSGATSDILQLPTASSQLLSSSTDSMDDSSALSQFLNGGGMPTSPCSDRSARSRKVSRESGSFTYSSLTTHHLASNISSTRISSIDSSTSSDGPSTSAGANRLAFPLLAGGMVAGLAALL